MHVMMSPAQDMTLQSFADPAFSSNLADPVVRRHYGLLSRLLTVGAFNCPCSCTSYFLFILFKHLQFREIALNGPDDVYSASVPFMDSTDNLTMAERAAT